MSGASGLRSAVVSARGMTFESLMTGQNDGQIADKDIDVPAQEVSEGRRHPAVRHVGDLDPGSLLEQLHCEMKLVCSIPGVP